MEDSTTIFKDFKRNVTLKFIMQDRASKSLNSVVISRDGKYLVSANRDISTVIIDLKSFQKVNEIK